VRFAIVPPQDLLNDYGIHSTRTNSGQAAEPVVPDGVSVDETDRFTAIIETDSFYSGRALRLYSGVFSDRVGGVCRRRCRLSGSPLTRLRKCLFSLLRAAAPFAKLTE
jgi:hypothetical protein